MLARNIQATNILLTSWAIVFLVVGITLKDWVELVSKTNDSKIFHSPWMECCPAMWPEDGLERVRVMMLSVLGLSVFLNFMMGLQFTYIIPQTPYMDVITSLLSFFTGSLLLFSIIQYRLLLHQGESVYFSKFEMTWVPLTTYLTTAFFFTCGFLWFIQCKLSFAICTCPKHQKSAEECVTIPKAGDSAKATFPGESTPKPPAPRGIMHPGNTSEDALNRSHLQERRVTWAL